MISMKFRLILSVTNSTRITYNNISNYMIHRPSNL